MSQEVEPSRIVSAEEQAQNDELIEALAEPAESLLDRHLSKAKAWYPHLFIPDRKFDPEEPWSPDQYPVKAKGVREAFKTNQLTEDNLPYYTFKILGAAPDGHPLKTWAMRWTAEENRHGIVMREFVHATRIIDPVDLEDNRMIQMSKGIVPNPETFADMIAYVSYQEKATQVAHRNTGAHLDVVGRRMLARVAGDENMHYQFYSDLAGEALKLNPSLMIKAMARQAIGFEMPGTGIPRFRLLSARIAKANIFTTQIFLDDVLIPTVGKWALGDVEGLDEEAERARVQLIAVTMPAPLLKNAATFPTEKSDDVRRVRE